MLFSFKSLEPTAKEFFTENSNGSHICYISVVSCGESAEPHISTVDSYLRNPAITVALADSSKAGRIAATYNSIKIIFTSRRFTEIFPAIISFITVDVVNILFGPMTGNHQKNEAMQIVSPHVVGSEGKTYTAVATETVSAGDAAYLGSPRAFDFPPNNASFAVVRKLRPYEFCRNIVARLRSAWFDTFSHSILQRSGWLEAGQGVLSAFLPRYSIGACNAQ
jgi:hypothetical protein